MSATIENGVLVKYDREAGVTAYHIPEGVTEIGPYAFALPFGTEDPLQEITLPGTLKKIDEFGLSGLHSCTADLIVPDSVTELGRGCFNSSSFGRIVLGRGIRSLPPFMCDGNMFLREIVIPDTVEELCTSCLGAVRGMRSLHLPDSIRIFRRRALTGSDLFEKGKVNFPKHVELVENLAFDGASGITEVELMDGIEKVWEGSFSGLPTLERVILPESVTEIGDKAFAYCKSLSDVRLPSALRRIGKRAFSGNSSLTEMVIPDGVEEIGPMAFYACVNLKKVVIPASVKRIGKDAFYNCPALETVELPAHLESCRETAFTC